MSVLLSVMCVCVCFIVGEVCNNKVIMVIF